MNNKPERCPLCGHEDAHIDKYHSGSGPYCGGALSCICSQTEYLAALRGAHSRDEEIAALVEAGKALGFELAAKNARIAELEARR